MYTAIGNEGTKNMITFYLLFVDFLFPKETIIETFVIDLSKNKTMNRKSTNNPICDSMSNEDFYRLRISLGYRYAERLRDRIRRNTKKKYSVSYMRKALLKKYATDFIVTHAIEMAQEAEENKLRARDFKTPYKGLRL
jgi:hypothetical protein